MRILHVQHVMDMGGAETMILQLAREQKRLGHDVTICILHGKGALDSRAAEFGIPLVHLYSPKKSVAKVRALYKYLGTEHYDVLHSHWGSWLAMAVAGFLRRTPRIHTNHSNQRRSWFLEHRIACLFTPKVVVFTSDIEPYIAKWVGVPRRKIEVIPNGIDFAGIESATRVQIEGISPDAPVVGMIARLSPPKDYSTFLKAAHLVGKERPDVRFVGVGIGAQLPQLEAEAAALRLENFTFLGGRSDVPSLLRRMTVLVLATRHEGHPMTLIEALVSGCACIGSDIPSIRFALEEGKSGLLVPGADPAALAKAILKLLNDPQLREQLVTRGREYSRRFHVSQMTKEYLDLYARVIAN